MDSFTQIVLGAAVGEAVLGRKVGNKAMLYGAIAGTIPDLDILSSHFTDTVSAIFGWLVSRYEKYKDVRGWSWLFFWALVTHPILDAFTTWGTQLFWPLDIRVALKTVSVIDPLYTVPFLVFLILAMFQKRTSKKRRVYNTIGLVLSSAYLALAFLLKWAVFSKFEDTLKEQNIVYRQIDTRPSPLNTILWSASVETDNAFLIGHYSFFDTRPISFVSYPKNHQLIDDLIQNGKMQRMINISKGWYAITKRDNNLYYNDLRFGLLSMEPEAQNFVFQYSINSDNTGYLTFDEAPKKRDDAKKLLSDLWIRIKGN